MLRLFLASYFFTQDGFLKDFTPLKHIVSLNRESGLQKFKNHKDILGKLKKDPSLISEYWKQIQENISINEKNKIFFIKTHNANIIYKKNEFTNKSFTRCFVYIVRDPRSVLLSMMSHYNLKTCDEAKKYLMSDNAITTVNNGFLPEIILSWKSHYISWKNFLKTDESLGMIKRYEDLVDKPEETFFKIIKFICKKNNLLVDKKKFLNSLESINFNKLKSMENKQQFPESVRSNQKFFRKGMVDEWKDVLPKKIISEIEKEYYNILGELKYI